MECNGGLWSHHGYNWRVHLRPDHHECHLQRYHQQPIGRENGVVVTSPNLGYEPIEIVKTWEWRPSKNHVYHWPLLLLQETVLNVSYCKACSPTETCTSWCSGSTTSMQHQPLCSGCLWMENPLERMLYFSILNGCGYCVKCS